MQTSTKGEVTIEVPRDMSVTGMAAFEEELAKLLGQKPPAIILDCSKLAHVKSRQVGILWQLYETCHSAGVPLKLKAASRGLMRVLQALDLREFFPEEDATGSLNVGGRCRKQNHFEETYQDRFHADVDSIARARMRFRSFLSDMGLSEVLEFELRTVFYEVTTNIQSYAALEVGDEIVFTVSPYDEMMVLTFTDPGIPFDPTSRSMDLDVVASAKSGQKRGFGLPMLSRLVDRISYRRKDGTMNELTLEKKWSQ